MKIAVYGQAYIKQSTHTALALLLDVLQRHKQEVYIETDFYNTLPKTLSALKNSHSFIELNETFDLLISVGGDGTILRAVTFVKNLNIPIVGINTGRLGFLATVQTESIETAIHDILSNNYSISKRSLLHIETSPQTSLLTHTNFALNEVTLSRKNTTSMITVKTHLNNEYLTTYWADGLILSTPTGSTGYSLSCGGPVIAPSTNSFVLTPIAPHNLSARPLVIPDDTTIELEVNGRENEFLMSLDSRIVTLPKTTKVTLKKATFFIQMIVFKDETFLDTLRQKLLWGEDRRN